MKRYNILILILIFYIYLVYGNVNVDTLHNVNQDIAINNPWTHPNGTLRSIRIGIVGAGIGGSSCAYYLNKIFNSSVLSDHNGQKNHLNPHQSSVYPLDITIFERERIGGRARSIIIDNGNVELGASIVHPLNENINQIVKDLGLEKVYGIASTKEEPYNIWNGNEMVFTESQFSFIDKIKLLVNYYWDPIRFKNSRDDIVQKFLSSYHRKEPFHTVEEFFQNINLSMTTNQTAKQFFVDDVGISENFIQDILSAAIRVNYNQNYDQISAFAALIALVGSEDGLYSIKGGNYQMAKSMIENSKSTTIHAEVRKIEKMDTPKDAHHPLYKVHTQNPAHPLLLDEHEFDFVVIAAPIELSYLEFSSNINTDFPKRDYKNVFVYLISAENLQPQFFNLPPNSKPPLHVLTSHNTSLPFFSVSKNPRGYLDDGRALYKIFAPLYLGKDLLDSLFNNYTVHFQHVWSAYPILTPTDKFPPINIDSGIFYVNSFEHAVSTMETETLSAKNIAKLIAKAIKRPYVDI
ncbi:hypothetical protein DLAC_05176 [Tieghemostelium lacteum]|uniref:Prenylcysteine lyase domain-containing protein n=1 Tax=Tieghemostelium lacteum TaxID=361077 RepID=A0A151ZII8_TIELA|nr:hypothetical protein DLAC_05176 [Tieghemostelium lacteum]|eukprot:KYQ93783.1 hypothetical protein DLAC_05176 [Tieghemostelium lacteum]